MTVYKRCETIITMERIQQFITFLDKDIWEIRLKDLSSYKAFYIRYIRIIILALQGFMKHDCIKTSAVLTYYTLLKIVPLVALVFAIAKGFGLKKIVESYIVQIADKINLQPDVTNHIFAFSNSLLAHAKGGIIAGAGTILMLWAVITTLGKIEDSFNIVWEVKNSRTHIRKFTDYIAILVIVPLLLAVSTTTTVLIASHIKLIVDKISLLGTFSSIIFFLLNLLPYISVWTLLVVLYIVMPNTRVPMSSGILAGIVAGTCFQIVQLIYIKFQIGVAGYDAIYGSFAALPLFLIWLQLSWMIVLFGAEIAYANNHYETFGFHPDFSRINGTSKKILMLRIFHLAARRFHLGKKPFSPEEISYELEIPVKLVQQILSELVDSGLVIKVIDENKGADAFQPSRSIENITTKDVLDAYNKSGEIPAFLIRSKEAQNMMEYLRYISDSIAKSPGNIKFIDI